jgi:hypothetical protein
MQFESTSSDIMICDINQFYSQIHSTHSDKCWHPTPPLFFAQKLKWKEKKLNTVQVSSNDNQIYGDKH